MTNSAHGFITICRHKRFRNQDYRDLRMSFSAKFSAAAVALAAVLAQPALSATLNEASLPAGSFSSAWSNPTIIANGYDTITGTGAGNQFDIFAFTGLTAGAQSLTFNFAAPSGISWSYAAGGNLLFSTQ
ncbi:MAG: hypothetical protein WAT77_14735, partial [Paracoccaceae bacterium]